ncbi:N-acetylglucosamine kinase [Pararcticibacter amylolyticus]|uniref:N-acetylglucosamine kinase n=1 Tax=Pararcticibacter amylolyticus TaxID=2173175 RepID=A0A2U2PC04_9SPHI|nr:N-acetylglucosamine kinase [Pararcticibacter amylolyticus]PWG78902.1 N-acetylglucosamine kinase [Pararcticibacter amylolyticus]
MILIADGGSTKTHWITTDSSIDFHSEGYNPYYVDEDYIVASLSKSLPQNFNPEDVTELYFYGAGVHNEEKAAILKNAFRKIFSKAQIEIDHDLLAACRALLGNNPGFAAILGTGTNTCLYNGKDIALNIDSAAYILGDEGSGCYMGKRLLKDIIRDTVPPEIKERFNKMYHLSSHEIMDNIYTKPLANRFCAGFVKFFDNNMDNEYCRNLIRSSFTDFFQELVALYPGYQELRFNCIGSVGFYFKDILTSVAAEFGMEVGLILQSPISGLREFHAQKAHMIQE